MKIVKSHLRNSIAVLLTVFVLTITVAGPLCTRACAAEVKASCCEGDAQCATPAASSSADCGHALVYAVERVEQPVTAAVAAYAVAPVRFELERGAAASAVGSPVRFGDLPPPRWFDPLVVSLRV